MSIDKDTVKHISKLARISLDENRIENLSKDTFLNKFPCRCCSQYFRYIHQFDFDLVECDLFHKTE